MIYQEEVFSEFLKDAKPILYEHWKELANYQDIRPLDPDYELYEKLNEVGVFKVFVARDGTDIAGYAWYYIHSNPHYKSWKYAACDLYYIRPKYRRTRSGLQMFVELESWLRGLGCQVVSIHDKLQHSHTKLLTRLGYVPVEMHYEKRL